ncbi:MAG: hypothetical protein ACK4MM_00605 [Fervidobacterium sp.]
MGKLKHGFLKMLLLALIFFLYGPINLLYADGYYIRMVYEESKSGSTLRSEEVFESGDIKIVKVNMPEKFTWMRIKDKWYIGDRNILNRTFPIKDLVDAAYDYVRNKKLDISKDGVYRFVEDFFTIEIFAVNGEIIRVTRTVADVTTTMYINKFPKDFDIKKLLSQYKFNDDTQIPEELFGIFKLFLWANVTETREGLKITGYDRDAKPIELELNKTNGELKFRQYYLKIIKASENTIKEIKNALRSN